MKDVKDKEISKVFKDFLNTKKHQRHFKDKKKKFNSHFKDKEI